MPLNPILGLFSCPFPSHSSHFLELPGSSKLPTRLYITLYRGQGRQKFIKDWAPLYSGIYLWEIIMKSVLAPTNKKPNKTCLLERASMSPLSVQDCRFVDDCPKSTPVCVLWACTFIWQYSWVDDQKDLLKVAFLRQWQLAKTKHKSDYKTKFSYSFFP